MLIEIHAIQNHSPSNLNRDDLGAPKTCYFGGVMRSRISSQCIKRSIRTSDQFKLLCGGIRTRRLPQHLAGQIKDKDVLPLADAVLRKCGLNKDEAAKTGKKDVIVFLSKSAIVGMAKLLREEAPEVTTRRVETLARKFAELVARDRFAPDMALSGRMLEPAKPAKPKKSKKGDGEDEGVSDQEDTEDGGNDKGVWKDLDLSIEAALQVAHAISTHEARPEVDYFVAADDIKGEDAGGAHIGESLFSSACFYKYFSIDWDTLLKNLADNAELAAHTVGAFLLGVALTSPSGKQNSFAAHQRPDGILVEVKKDRATPVSYANAFASPVPSIVARDTISGGPHDIISQSIAQLGQYVHDLDTGYGMTGKRFWFSPNLRYELTYSEDKRVTQCTDVGGQVRSLDELVVAVVKEIGFDWDHVQSVTVNTEV